MKKAPFLGFGLGLRTPHYQDIINSNPAIDWFEIISESFLLEGGKTQYYLDYFNERYTLIPHGVSLSIGSIDALDMAYLKKLKTLLDKLNPPWFSDHICWTKIHGNYLHNLMPLPYTEETVQFVSKKIKQVQDYIERPFIFENVSSYVEFEGSQMQEWDFVKAVATTADCGILLDINNVYVSSFNHNFDPLTYINAIPKERVYQFHIAGHRNKGHYILDTHDEDVCDEVWQLYQQVLPLFPDTSVLLERDDNIPPLTQCLNELNYARHLHKKQLQHA